MGGLGKIEIINNPKNYSNSIEDLSIKLTNDGSLSLHSGLFNESFHDHKGAKQEAILKFLNPSQINHLGEDLKILDVCLGLGYNSCCIFEELLEKKKIKITWRALEIDQRPLKIALGSMNFRKNWSNKTLMNLELINTNGEWENKTSNGKILWGDARQTIDLLPSTLKFDLILLDPFSPSKCPQLWSEEFLHKLVQRMAPGGRLTTYCRAAAIRSSLRRAGLDLQSITSTSKDSKDWNQGTVGILKNKDKRYDLGHESLFRDLTRMEEEHLETKSAIPYRDLSGLDTAEKILKRRQLEQKESKMESTNKWKKRWGLL